MIPFFTPLLALCTCSCVASFAVVWIIIPFFFASPSRTLDAQVESTVWVYWGVSVASFAVFGVWACNDRSFAATLQPDFKVDAAVRIRDFCFVTSSAGKRGVNWHNAVTIIDLVVEFFQFNAYSLGRMPGMPNVAWFLRSFWEGLVLRGLKCAGLCPSFWG
jgi:hypothetical protein